MKNFYSKVEIPIYDKVLHICFSDSIKKANSKLIKKDLDPELTANDFKSEAIAVMDFSDKLFGAVIIFTNTKEITYGIIAHEVDHVVHNLLSYIGMRRTNSSEEAYSYLQEYLVNKIINIFKQKKIKII